MIIKRDGRGRNTLYGRSYDKCGRVNNAVEKLLMKQANETAVTV